MLTAARVEEISERLPAMTRKALDAVPLAEEWNGSQIYAELVRCGHRLEMRHLMSCLQNLKCHSLVREPRPGYFVRSRVKESPMSTQPILTEVPRKPEAANASNKSPLDRLGTACAGLRVLASQLADAADQIEAAGMDFESAREGSDDELKKMHALKDLLRSFT